MIPEVAAAQAPADFDECFELKSCSGNSSSANSGSSSSLCAIESVRLFGSCEIETDRLSPSVLAFSSIGGASGLESQREIHFSSALRLTIEEGYDNTCDGR